MNEEQNPLRGSDRIRGILSQIRGALSPVWETLSPIRRALSPIRGILFHSLMWILVLIYLESLLHGVVFHSLTARYFYILGFSLPIALVLSLPLGLLPKRIDAGVSIALTSVLCVVFGSQLVYYFVFGDLYSVSMVGLGGEAIASFWKETLLAMGKHVGPLLLCILPIPAVCLACRFLPEIFQRADLHDKTGWYGRSALAAVAVVVQAAMVLSLPMGGTGFYSPYSFYHGNDATTNQTTDAFGLLTALRLELTHSVSGGETQGYYTGLPPAMETIRPVASKGGLPEEPQVREYGWNVLDIDLDTLDGLTKDQTILALNSYISSLTGTQKNEYTGMLSDYNLIVLCAEAFSTAALDPELTPTLYRMAHEGFVFNHYYNTFPNNTTDGEYALCLGLLPDKTRSKAASSFYASRNSYLPMALGNIFSEQRGIQGYAYHDYVGSFYGRYLTHPNMGYKCKFAKNGMSFTTSWPASDLEMMEQSIPDYLSQEQFLAYYMTFSGHMEYNRSVNPMARRNYDLVRDLPYSETAKCYLSGNIELEKAMAYLMEQLEEAGVADRTAIVLAGDHFPYGLTNAQYNELIGYEADFFEKYHDTLIFWVGGMEEPVEVDAYCCNIDVLPTILNLWGFDFDSRLLAGTDILSTGAHAAVLVDQSFLTDTVWFNANTNTATWLVEEGEVPENYLDYMIRMVKNKFSFSTDILNTAYYNFIFDEGAVKVNKSGWISQEDWDINFGGGKSKNDEPQEGSPGVVEDPEEPQEETPPETGAETVPEGQAPEQGQEPVAPPEEQTPEAPPETVPEEQGPGPGPETPPEVPESGPETPAEEQDPGGIIP